MLLTGTPPFRGRRDHDVLAAVRRGHYSLSALDSLSTAAKDFIAALLTYDPRRRLSVKDALAHPWLEAARRPASETLPMELIPRVQHFAHLHGWKRAALEAVAFSLTPVESGETVALRRAFELCDDGMGHVSVGSLTSALGRSGVGADEALSIFTAMATSKQTASYSEFVAAALPRRVLTTKLLKEAFDALDSGSRPGETHGYLTLDGLTRQLGRNASAFDLDQLRHDLFSSGLRGRCSFEVFANAFYKRAAGEDEEEAVTE